MHAYSTKVLLKLVHHRLVFCIYPNKLSAGKLDDWQKNLIDFELNEGSNNNHNIVHIKLLCFISIIYNSSHLVIFTTNEYGSFKCLLNTKIFKTFFFFVDNTIYIYYIYHENVFVYICSDPYMLPESVADYKKKKCWCSNENVVVKFISSFFICILFSWYLWNGSWNIFIQWNVLDLTCI